MRRGEMLDYARKYLGWGVVLSLTRACWGWAGGKPVWVQKEGHALIAAIHLHIRSRKCASSSGHSSALQEQLSSPGPSVSPRVKNIDLLGHVCSLQRWRKDQGGVETPTALAIAVFHRAWQWWGLLTPIACLCCWRRVHRLCTPWVLPCTCWVLWELPWCLTFPGAPLVRYHGCDGALTWYTRRGRSPVFGGGSLCVQLLNFTWVWDWTSGCSSPLWEPVRLGAAGWMCAAIFSADADTVYVWDKHWAANAQRGAENFWEF